MGISHLHGLAQMSINRDLIDPEKVVDEVAENEAASELNSYFNELKPIS